MITLYSDASYATTQIYIVDYSFNNGIYVRTKGGKDWTKFSGTKILAKKAGEFDEVLYQKNLKENDFSNKITDGVGVKENEVN